MTDIKRLAIAIGTALLVAVPAAAQAPSARPDTAKVRLIKLLLTKVRVTDQALQAMEQQVPAQRAANSRVPAIFWDRFLEQARARRAELEEGYVSLYDRHFSTDEIRQLLAFYDTPVGRRFLDEQPALVREGIAMGQEWGQRIGADVGRTLAGEGVQFAP